MGLFIKNVCFIGATCWLLYIWATGERMDDLLLAIPLFFVTGFWLSRHGRRKKKLKVDLEEADTSNAKQDASPVGLYLLILFIAGAVIMSNYDAETPEDRADKHTSCLRSLAYVNEKNRSEGRNNMSDGMWQTLYQDCISRPPPG